MDPVSQMAQAHAGMVLQHMMNGGMGHPGLGANSLGYQGPPVIRGWNPQGPPFSYGQPGDPPGVPDQPVGLLHPGLLHLLGLGGRDYRPGGPIRLNPGGPGAPFGPPNGGVITGQLPPGYGPPGPVGPVNGPYQPLSIKAWNA